MFVGGLSWQTTPGKHAIFVVIVRSSAVISVSPPSLSRRPPVLTRRPPSNMDAANRPTVVLFHRGTARVLRQVRRNLRLHGDAGPDHEAISVSRRRTFVRRLAPRARALAPRARRLPCSIYDSLVTTRPAASCARRIVHDHRRHSVLLARPRRWVLYAAYARHYRRRRLQNHYCVIWILCGASSTALSPPGHGCREVNNAGIPIV